MYRLRDGIIGTLVAMAIVLLMVAALGAFFGGG